MSRSRKKNPTAVDIPKGSWKHEYNSRVRTTSNQILKQIINGKIDPDELILPETEDLSDIWVSPKEDVTLLLPPNKPDTEYYEKSFRK